LILGEFSVLSSLYILVISLIWYIASKDFLPFCGWSLQFRDKFFCCAAF
jgi:hypothetical protein